MSLNFFKIKQGLTLDPQSQYGAGDPATGTNGDIYYNSVLNRFRAFINGAWYDLNSSPNAEYVSQEIPLALGTNSLVVTFPSPQIDTSYVVFAMMENVVDANPEFQTIEVTSKSVSGFTASWNMPTDTANYVLSYIVPSRVLTSFETSVASSSTSVTNTYVIPQPTSSYYVIAQMQNIVDANPQFQPLLLNGKTTLSEAFSWNTPTSSGSYVIPSMLNANTQVAVPAGATSATLPLPINYGTSSYGVIATMSNNADLYQVYQPMIVTAKMPNSVTISWNIPTNSNNYVLQGYTISNTA